MPSQGKRWSFRPEPLFQMPPPRGLPPAPPRLVVSQMYDGDDDQEFDQSEGPRMKSIKSQERARIDAAPLTPPAHHHDMSVVYL